MDQPGMEVEQIALELQAALKRIDGVTTASIHLDLTFIPDVSVSVGPPSAPPRCASFSKTRT